MNPRYRITPLKDARNTTWAALWPEEKARALGELARRAELAAQQGGGEALPLPVLPEEHVVVPLEAAARALGKTPGEVLREAATKALDRTAAEAVHRAAFPATVASGEVRGRRLRLWSPELGILEGVVP